MSKKLLKDIKNHPSAEDHARRTIELLEYSESKRRGRLKDWEECLLHSAYNVLEVPTKDRIIVMDWRAGNLVTPRWLAAQGEAYSKLGAPNLPAHE